MSCDRCVWSHNNKIDIEEPLHCKCNCHYGLQNSSTNLSKLSDGEAKDD